LKPGGYAMISIKARSIDVNAKPSEVFAEEETILKEHFEIIDKKRLEPYEKDHIIFLLKKKL
jgi:fibrillarin-like pre-rRNA processing protein